MTRFNNKTIVITGGTSGIGLAGARRAIAEGGRVLATGNTASRIEEAQHLFTAGSMAIRNDAAAADAGNSLAEAARPLGAIDGLWLNAGYAALGAVEDANAEDFDAMMHTNVRGPTLQLAALLPQLRDGASVVVTSSSAAYEAESMISLYAATKGALVSMARCWATALAPRGIRVNVLLPGPIDTRLRDSLPSGTKRDFERSVLTQVPLSRVGSAAEAAAVALFLLSDDASYVTGSQYAVDGGMIMQ